MSAPAKNDPKLKNNNLARARDCWDRAPDWVLALAESCNGENQTAIGKRLGYSGSTVSQVLSNTYPGDLERIEQVVRGVLMAETVICPRLGETSRNVCQQWQRRPFSTASSNAVAMYQACRAGCPHSRLPKLELGFDPGVEFPPMPQDQAPEYQAPGDQAPGDQTGGKRP